MSDDIPTFEGANYEERMKQWEKEKKGILRDLQDERNTRQSLEQRLAVIENSLTSAGEDGETVEQKVQRLANQPDEYIDSRLQQYDESRVKVLEGEIQSLKIDRDIERGLRWVARQEKKDYEDVAGSELEEELARMTLAMKARGIIPTGAYEGTKQAYKMLLDEKREKEEKEKNRDKTIENNRTEEIRSPSSSGKRVWTPESVQALSLDEFTKNEEEIKRQALSWSQK